MKIPRRFLSTALIAVAGIMVLLGTLCFSSLRHGYSQIANTISELGETGASHAALVAFCFFLPVGLMVWLALWLLRRATSDRDASPVLFPMFCLGAGYVVSAFFPCDPGAPLWGSWRTLVHNVAGLVDYGGTAIGFLIVWRCLARGKATAQAAAFGVGGVLVLVCLVVLCVPSAFPVRGAVQRVAELIQFTGVFCVCLLLPRIETPNERLASTAVRPAVYDAKVSSPAPVKPDVMATQARLRSVGWLRRQPLSPPRFPLTPYKQRLLRWRNP